MSGEGFLSGQPNRLRLSPSEAGGGRVVLPRTRFDVFGPRASFPETSARCTRVEGVGPLEHLAAAAAILGVPNWELEADHGDLPIFDGSALRWAEAIRAMGIGSGPLIGPSVLHAVWQETRGRSFLRAEPSDRLEIRIEWTDGVRGPEIWSGGSSTLPDLIPARTFVRADQWWEIRSRGLMKGIGPGSGRLLQPREPLPPQAMAALRQEGVHLDGPAWTGGAERIPSECAAHKALDLVGDIAVAMGYLPALRITARDAGHSLHAELGRALREALAQA